MDEFFPIDLFFIENNKRIIPVSYDELFYQKTTNKYTTYFSVNFQEEEYTEIFYGEQTFKYNKKNLSKIYLNAIKNVKYNIIYTDIVFNYLLNFLNKNTDLYSFFEKTYTEHLNKLIFKEITPPDNAKKHILSFLSLTKINSYLHIKTLKIDLTLISKDNFYIDLIEPLKKMFIFFNGSQSNSYIQKWVNYIKSQFSVILPKQNLDNIFQIKIDNKNCYSSFFK